METEHIKVCGIQKKAVLRGKFMALNAYIKKDKCFKLKIQWWLLKT